MSAPLVLTEADIIAGVEEIARLTSKRRIRWMVDPRGNERWGYDVEPVPKGWRHLCWQEE